MENKLYFAPAKFGKGKKKKQKSSGEGDKQRFWRLAGFLMILLAIGCIIFWLLHGKTTVSGNFPANIGAESLTCSKENATYEKINYSGGKQRARITAIFDGAETLHTLSFNYSIIFSNENEAKTAEGAVHYKFGRNLSDDNLSFSEFSNKFSVIGNELAISLFAEQNEIKPNTTGYFMLIHDDNRTSLADYRKAYEAQGFSCTSTIDDK